MATKKDTLKDTSEKLGKLFDLYPVDFTMPKETNMAMREALARLYADPALRSFLENAVKFANRSLIASATLEQSIFYKSRIETLMQLLNMGKQHFIHFEMKKARKEPLQMVGDMVAEIKL
jgi:pantoate kinase